MLRNACETLQGLWEHRYQRVTCAMVCMYCPKHLTLSDAVAGYVYVLSTGKHVLLLQFLMLQPLVFRRHVKARRPILQPLVFRQYVEGTKPVGRSNHLPRLRLRSNKSMGTLQNYLMRKPSRILCFPLSPCRRLMNGAILAARHARRAASALHASLAIADTSVSNSCQQCFFNAMYTIALKIYELS